MIGRGQYATEPCHDALRARREMLQPIVLNSLLLCIVAVNVTLQDSVLLPTVRRIGHCWQLEDDLLHAQFLGETHRPPYYVNGEI